MNGGVVRLVRSTALLVGVFLALQLRPSGEAAPIRETLDNFPLAVGEWRQRERLLIDAETLSVLRPTDYLVRRYEDSSAHSVLLYISYWAAQGKGVQPHSPKNCLPGSGWDPLEASVVTIPLAAPYPPVKVNRYLVQKDQERALVFYWYQSRGHVIPGEIAARIDMVKGALLSNRTDGALVRVSIPLGGNPQETEASLIRYIQTMYPMLGDYIPS